MIDRRAVFFLIAAAMCGAMVPLSAASYRFVPVALCILYLLLALGSWLDHRSAGKGPQ